MSVREAQWDLPGDLVSVAKARDIVRTTLLGWGLLSQVDDTVLIVSELYTNAIEHAPPGSIALRLRFAGPCLGGEISDAGAVFVPRQRPSDDAEHGRGLQIVAALSTRWGVEPQGTEGKTVWFTICR